MLIRRRRAGFEVIELLVVIACLAILAAILYPVFAKANKHRIEAAEPGNRQALSPSPQPAPMPAPSDQTPEAYKSYPAPGQEAPPSPHSQEATRDTQGAGAQELEVREGEMPSVVCPYCRNRVFVSGSGR